MEGFRGVMEGSKILPRSSPSCSCLASCSLGLQHHCHLMTSTHHHPQSYLQPCPYWTSCFQNPLSSWFIPSFGGSCSLEKQKRILVLWGLKCTQLYKMIYDRKYFLRVRNHNKQQFQKMVANTTNITKSKKLILY